jgi:hypothetical protein
MTKELQYEDIDQSVKELVKNRESFTIIGLTGKMSDAVEKIEAIIEREGLSCRIYTRGRITATGGSFLGGVTGVAGLVSAIGIAAHNIATYDPDYEVAKHIVDNMLTISYEK